MPKTILIIGGARSGKSHFAQQLASNLGGPVLFVATAEASDEEMRQRIEAHRRSRPAEWRILEANTHIGGKVLKNISGNETVIIDCITLLINNILLQHCDPPGGRIDAVGAEKAVATEIAELIDCIGRVDATFIIVTNEVGLGIVPADSMTRLYRDLLGKANQSLTQRSDEVYLMVAGIAMPVKPGKK